MYPGRVSNSIQELTCVTWPRTVCHRTFVGVAIFVLSIFAPVPARAQKTTQTVTVAGNQSWVDTNMDVTTGEKVRVTATGTIQYPAEQNRNGQSTGPQSTGPDGLSRGWKDLLRIYPVADANRGALIGRIGNDDAAQAFLIGASKDVTATYSGRLFLGINQQKKEEPEGSYSVTIEVLESPPKPGQSTPAAKGIPETSISSITPAVLNKIPRRVADKTGNPGDMVNFLLIGSEADMQQAFKTAGWVQVDKTTQDALIHGLVSTLSKQAYLEMPMSMLYLFGRSQDYGFAHAVPIEVAKTRNHLRIWKAPFDVDGQTLWVGAATHDIGFEQDERNNGVTHKIDPDIDKEREYVGETLYDTGLVTKFEHVTPSDPLKEAKTATGGSFHSDGRLIVMSLKNSAGEKSAVGGS
jgi:hypothetical protein